MYNENDKVQQEHTGPDRASPVMEQAMDWLIRLDDASDEEREAFSLWMDASPEHAAAFERAEGIWLAGVTQAAAERVEQRIGMPAAAPRPMPQSNQRPNQHPKPTPRPRRRARRWAVAASVVFALALGWRLDPLVRLQADYHTAQGEPRQLSLGQGVLGLEQRQLGV